MTGQQQVSPGTSVVDPPTMRFCSTLRCNLSVQFAGASESHGALAAIEPEPDRTGHAEGALSQKDDEWVQQHL